MCLWSGTDYSVAFLLLVLLCGCCDFPMFVLCSYKILQLPVLHQIPLCWQLYLRFAETKGKLQTQSHCSLNPFAVAAAWSCWDLDLGRRLLHDFSFRDLFLSSIDLTEDKTADLHWGLWVCCLLSLPHQKSRIMQQFDKSTPKAQKYKLGNTPTIFFLIYTGRDRTFFQNLVHQVVVAGCGWEVAT